MLATSSCAVLALIAILILIIIVISFWAYCKFTNGLCKFSGHLVGKVAIITGGNSGIGFETAKDLAQRGARIIIACRNLERGSSAREKIIESSGNNDVCLLYLDLASLSSIRKFVDEVLNTESRLDILINNAGQYTTENMKTEDGLLMGMQINYFGPFLLTTLLLPLLKVSAPSRIINVSSMLHVRGKIDLENLNMEKENARTFNIHQVYCNAKLCTVLMTAELGRKLKGIDVTVNCLHPGMVKTEMVNHFDIWYIRFLLKLIKHFFKTPWEGAQTAIYLAVSPNVRHVSGSYFKDCHESITSTKAQDLDLAIQLWETSEKLVNF